jgi:hypothetical protein
MKKKELDKMLDQIAAGIRSEQAHDLRLDEAAGRVRSQVTDARGIRGHDAAGPVLDRIEGCSDFQALIPSYLSGHLSEARSLLLVDHTHECIPCRRAMKQARQARVAPPAAVKRKPKTQAYGLRPVVLRWGIAAAVVIGLGLIALPLIQRYVPIGSFEATVQAADGPLYVVADSQTRLLNVGEKIGRGDVIRTAKDGHAVLRLTDGSTIEMKDRSEFSMNRTLSGTTVHLDSGSVIVEAAKQKGHMYVDTGDSLVSVTGTTFAVNAGTKGSRVSVINGEVHVDRNGEEKVLRAGEQTTSNASIEPVPIKEEVAWSRNATRYAQLLDAMTSLRKELNAVSKPGVRNSTRLLDMMPQTTVMYAAFPNLAASIAESDRIIEERIQQNPALHDWFANRPGPHGPGMNQAIATIKDFGDQLGEEIAVGAGMNDQGQPTQPLVLAELKSPASFHAFFDSEVQKLSANAQAPQVVWIDDPKTGAPANSTSSDHSLYVWIDGDVLVASPKLDQLQAVANAANGFSGTPFYSRIAQVYQEGAGIVVAADLEKIIAHTRGVRRIAVGDSHEQALNQLGVFNMTSFVLDQKDTGGKTHTRAVLSYNQSDHGITSWLAQPAPMGSLEYISPDANLVAGFAIKNPTAVIDDLLGVIGNVCPDLNKHLEDLEKNHGLNLRNDFAAPLGGEYAFAIDGPILPTPSWKLVLQVNDPVHLQQTIEQVVSEVNKQLAKEGKQGVEWDRAETGGRTFYTLRAKDVGAVEFNYVFANGYLIAGPTRALVEQALRFHDSGSTLVHSPQFTAGLPADGNVNFSAFVYQNIASAAKQVGNLPGVPPRALAMATTMEPTLAYAYAYGDHIEFAANTEGGPFGFSPATLLGMPNAFELHHILEQGLKGAQSNP